jgi:hypothetical protein
LRSKGVEGVRKGVNPGFYFVNFADDVGPCTPIATIIYPAGPSLIDTGVTTSPNIMIVETYNGATGTLAERNFSIAVYC